MSDFDEDKPCPTPSTISSVAASISQVLIWTLIIGSILLVSGEPDILDAIIGYINRQ